LRQVETWLRLFGISFASVDAANKNAHLVTVSAILCLSGTFKSAVQCLLQGYTPPPGEQQYDFDNRNQSTYSSHHKRQGANNKDHPSHDDTDHFYPGAELNSDVDKYKRKTITKQQVLSTFQ
jgi:hypothetical protein